MIHRALLITAVLVVCLPMPTADAVVGGVAVVDRASAPWAVSIDAEGLCSGTLIDPWRVVTAAHCVADVDETFRPDQVTVSAGVVDVGSPGQEVRPVGAIVVHPSHKPTRDRIDRYDVAVLVLAVPFPVIPGRIAPIPVGAPQDLRSDPLELFGWGDVALRTAPVPLRLHTLRAVPTRTVRCEEGLPSLACLISKDSSGCDGDSGAGVVRRTSSGPVLVAVFNFAYLRCDRGKPQGVTNVSEPGLARWIANPNDVALAPSILRRPQVNAQTSTTLVCSDARIRGATSTETAWVQYRTGRTLSTGASRRFTPTPGLRREAIDCIITASNDAGTVQASATNTYRLGGG